MSEASRVEGGAAASIALELLAEGAGWVAVNKPAGMLSVPGKEVSDSVLTRVRAVFPDAEAPHRLDMDTSGVIVVATDKASMRYISRGFERRKQRKVYVAVVEGLVDDTSGVVDAPIEKDWENRPYMRVRPSGKPSSTAFRVVARFEGPQRTSVRLEPRTGRTHQLRVHMAHMGHPIVGDVLYGRGFGPSAPRLMLHAWRFAFARPEDEAIIEVEAPLPFRLTDEAGD